MIILKDKYKVMYRYSPEECKYLIFKPEIPECWVDNESLSQGLKEIENLEKELIEYYKEKGINVPHPLNKIELSDASIYDIAEFILRIYCPVNMERLLELLFFCKLWCLNWYDVEIFSEEVVNKEIIKIRSDKETLHSYDFKTDHELSESEKLFIKFILLVYG